MDKGLVHVYTGDGKGKTTAAIGLGIRAVGRRKRVCMIQFLKGISTGEMDTLQRLQPEFQVFRFEKIKKFFWDLNQEEKVQLKQQIGQAFQFARKLVSECDILILDEIMGVLQNKLLEVREVAEFIRNKPAALEVVLTGRNAPEEIIELADYVSEIKAVKHPLEKGIPARKGIEY